MTSDKTKLVPDVIIVQKNFFTFFLGHSAEIAAGIVGGATLVLAVTALLIYRNWKYEQELDSLLWKIEYKDIEITEPSSVSNISQYSDRLVKVLFTPES